MFGAASATFGYSDILPLSLDEAITDLFAPMFQKVSWE